MPVFKNNIVTPFQTETYWIYNPFLSHMPRLLLIINTIWAVRAALYLHVRGRLCKRLVGGGGIEDVLMRFFKCGSFSLFFLQIKAAINKPVTKRLWFTYPRPAMFRVPLSSSLLRTRWLAVCTLLAANIKDAHTELISRGHLYNNTFARSQWCSFWLGAAAHSAICLEYGDFFLNSLWMLCI